MALLDAAGDRLGRAGSGGYAAGYWLWYRRCRNGGMAACSGAAGAGRAAGAGGGALARGMAGLPGGGAAGGGHTAGGHTRLLHHLATSGWRLWLSNLRYHAGA